MKVFLEVVNEFVEHGDTIATNGLPF